MPERRLRIGLSPRLLHDPPPELGFPGKTLQYLEQSIAHWVMSHEALAYMIPTLGVQAEVSRREKNKKREKTASTFYYKYITAGSRKEIRFFKFNDYEYSTTII